MKPSILGVALLAIALPLRAQQADSLRAQITRVNQEMMAAYNRGDARAVAAYYTDDARITGPTGVVSGRAGVDRYWTSFPTSGRRWTLDVFEVAGDSTTAFQLGRSAIASPNGAMVTDFVGVWKRQPGSDWRLALDAWTGRRPQNDAPIADSIRALDAGWARSYATHDTTYARALFADEIAVISSNGRVKDKEGELADVRAQPNLKMDYFRTSNVEVRVHGGVAIATGTAEWSFAFNGRPSTARRAYSAAYIRGGPLGWRMAALHLRAVP